MPPLMTLIENARVIATAFAITTSLFLAGCGGGGGGENDDQIEPVQLTVVSTPELDGLTAIVGQSTDSATDIAPAVGDFASNIGRDVVGYYSFDLSQIPAGARIVSARLSLFSSRTLNDPEEMMVHIKLDHVNYGNLFPQVLLAGAALDLDFAQIDDVNTTGRKDVDVTAQLQDDLDSGRTTSQYRLRGAVGTDNDNQSDVVVLTDAEDTEGTGELPMLIIEYTE
ncbi:MAG: hypothetical protein QNJ98_19210 [Planctomycetota bacterium]|nr:hypothetical protein [Planctomycetota bacterium]